MYKRLYVLLLLASPLTAAPEVRDSLEQDLEKHAQSGVSGEHLHDSQENVKLDFEESTDWSESTEVLDENHAWYPKTVKSRRKRSLDEKEGEVLGLEELTVGEFENYPKALDHPEDIDHPEDLDLPEELDNPKDLDHPEDLDNPEDLNHPEDLRHSEEENWFSQLEHLKGLVRSSDKRIFFPEDQKDFSDGVAIDKEDGRSKRSLEAEEKDLEVAESVVFMPAHLRQKKKRAIEECSKHQSEYRNKHSRRYQRPLYRCNEYCCYPVYLGSL